MSNLGAVGRAYPLLLLAIGAGLCGAILYLAAVIVQVTSSDDWAPLGPFPVQTVVDERPQPFDVTDLQARGVAVRATKCRHTDAELGMQVRGELAWRRVDPPGYVAPEQLFPAVLVPEGCPVTVFDNAPPQEVVDLVCAVPGAVTAWQITGSELPVGEVVSLGGVGPPQVESRTGLRLGWETESFLLTCSEGSRP